MGLTWEESYQGQIRTLAGDDRTLFMTGARCVVRDDQGRVLLIRRSDNGQWAYPAGTMELGETISQCAIREVFEETGLTARAVTLIGVYSNVEHMATPNVFGHRYQFITVAFRVDGYDGELVRVTDETTDAAFFAPEEFPDGLGDSVRRTLADLEEFEKTGLAFTD